MAKTEQEIFNDIQMKLSSQIPFDQDEINFLENTDKLPSEAKKYYLALNKTNSGQELSQEEQDLIQQIMREREEEQHLNQQLMMVPEIQRDLYRFQDKTKKHIDKGGKRIIHITDTEASSSDLEQIVKQNLNHAGGFSKGNDIVIHTGDMIQDFIDFKNMSHGTQGFASKRIINEGGLEGEIAEEFEEIYKYLLNQHGVDEFDLLEGNMSEQMMQGLQQLYFGGKPNFKTNAERKEYEAKFEKFKEYITQAIKHDAKKQYQAAKELFESEGLTPDDMIITEGNHDVPDAMREVLGEYMPAAGTVVERQGMRFGVPMTGSTGSILGPEFVDVFGYTDIKEQLTEIKYGTQAFQDLKQELTNNGVDYLSNKDIEMMMRVSKQRSAQGIGRGALTEYFDRRIKPEIDATVDAMRGKIVNQIPKDVDFYVMHGMPNHPSFAGIEERAVYNAISKSGGGNIIHGHIHGKTTHKMGNNLLLNMGDGKQAFGVYHYDTDNRKVTDIFSRTHNQAFGDSEFELKHADQISVQQNTKQYQ